MNIRWNQIAVAVAAGFLIGALFSDYYHMHIKRRPPRLAPAEGAIAMFTRALDLSGQQKDQVSAIIDKYRPEIKTIKDSINPRLEDLRVRLKAELKTVLSTEQYAKLDKLDNESKRWDEPPAPDRPGRGAPPR